VARIKPVDSSLNLKGDRDKYETKRQSNSRRYAKKQVGSYKAYHTPRTRNVRVRHPLGFLLPGKKHLAWAAAIALGWLAWDHIPRPLPVVETDREEVPTADDIAKLTGEFIYYPDSEKTEKWRGWGGSTKFRYDYASLAPQQPEIKALSWNDTSVEAARETFQKTQLHTVFDWGIGGKDPVGLVWLDEHTPWAEESRIYRVELEHTVLGYSVTLREGTRTVYAKLKDIDLKEWELREICDQLLNGS